MTVWTTYNRNYIVEILEYSLTKKLNRVEIKQIDGRMIRDFAGSIYKILPDRMEILLDKTLSDDQIEFDAKSPVLIQGVYRNFTFKKDMVSQNNKTISFPLPFEMKLSDRRKVKRFYYKYQDHKKITILLTDESIEESKRLVDATLVDISIRGIGIVLSERNAIKIMQGQSIFIKSISDQNLAENHHAHVIHVSKYGKEEGKNKSVKLGIEFQQSLESVNYKSISEIIHKKQKKCDGLDVQTFAGLTEEEQERKLAMVRMENPIVARELTENIEYLDKIRFMTKTMKQNFLKEVNHSILATALRMSTKEVIYDLLVEVSETLQEEILFELKDVKTATMVREAQTKLCKILREKEAKGEIVLDPDMYDTYV